MSEVVCYKRRNSLVDLVVLQFEMRFEQDSVLYEQKNFVKILIYLNGCEHEDLRSFLQVHEDSEQSPLREM